MGKRTVLAQVVRGLLMGFGLVALLVGVGSALSELHSPYTVRIVVMQELSLANGAETAIDDFYRIHHRLPASNASVGIAAATSISGNYVSSVTVGEPRPGMISIRYGGPKADARINAATSLELSPILDGGKFRWTCHSTSLPAKYLPAACR